MNILKLIQSNSDNYTKNEQEIANYILENPLDTTRITIDALASQTNTSKAAIVRFTKKIGFEGFSEFKYAFSRFLVSNNNQDQENENSFFVLDTYIEKINEIKNYVSSETLDTLITKIIKANRIRIIGKGRSNFSAKQLESRLLRIGIETKSIDISMHIIDTLELLNDKDLVIIFTSSDNYRVYHNYVDILNGKKCPIIFMTMNPTLPYKDLVDHYVTLPRVSLNNQFSFLDDQTIFFVFIEVILKALVKKINKD